MRMSWLTGLVGILFLLTLGACAKSPPLIDRQLGLFTLASTRNVPQLKTKAIGKIRYAVKGQSCVEVDPKSLAYISGPRENRIQRAMDEAIANGHDQGFRGEVLLNVRLWEKTIMLPPPGKAKWASSRRMECVVVSGELAELQP